MDLKRGSKNSEPVFVDLLRSPGIDSQHGRPGRQPYLSYRPARLHRLAEPVHQNQFLGSINVYKYELRELLTHDPNLLEARAGLVPLLPFMK
jgi:hypothetical protein